MIYLCRHGQTKVAADPAPVKVVFAHGLVSRVIRGLHCNLAKTEALPLPTPQDALFALHPQGCIAAIGC